MNTTIKRFYVGKWKTGCAAILSAVLLHCTSAVAEDTTDSREPVAAKPSDPLLPLSIKSIWLNAGMFSHHFDRSQNYEENNHGIGIEVNLNDEHAAYAGHFLNSVHEQSNMVGWVWRPWMIGPLRVGAVGGLIDGYPRANNGGWFLAALPVASLEYRHVGVNFLILPDIGDKVDGAAVVQFKLRLK